MAKRGSQVPSDVDHEDTPGRTISKTSEEELETSEEIDATPFITPNIEYESSQSSESESEDSGPPTEITAIMPVSKDGEFYNMKLSNRGICFVFNQTIFRSPQLKERLGSDKDVLRIENTFCKLGFKVTVRDNLLRSEIKTKIEELSKQTDHKDNDCICIFVLTHGTTDGYLLAKNKRYDSKKIWKPFTANNCPTLAGKPKLIFFMACRGDKWDHGVRMSKPSDIHIDHDGADSTLTDHSYTIPRMADFLIVHSTATGYVSKRCPKKGTPFVQSLCNVLDAQLEDKSKDSFDFLKILTTTARKVAIDFPSKPQQVPSVTSTLTRELYFGPKKIIT